MTKTNRPGTDIHNQAVAELLGMSMSGVSRLRTGSRNPSPRTMVTIEERLGWPATKQLEASLRGEYAQAFNLALRRYQQKQPKPELADAPA